MLSPSTFALDAANSNLKNNNVEQEILQLQQTNSVYERVIKNLILRIEKLEGSVLEITDSNKVESDKSEIIIDPDVRARLEKESLENSRLINTAFEQRLSKEGGMLLGQYQFIYEPGLSFSHSSYDKIVVDGFTIFPVLVIGDIVSEKVNRDIISVNQSFRYGLGWDMQLDVFIPLGYEKEDSFREDGFHQEKTVTEFGDVSVGISYQLLKSHSYWPDTLAALNWKTTTGKDPYLSLNADELAMGSGCQSYGRSVTSVSNSDPIVLFGGFSVNYAEGDRKQIGHVKPGLNYGLNMGMVLALNFDASLSFNFQYSHSGNTEINGQEINGSNLTTSIFSMGFSMAKGHRYSVDVDLGIGLTAESPDFQLSVSFPFNFTLR